MELYTWETRTVTSDTPATPSRDGLGYPIRERRTGLVVARGVTSGGARWVRVLTEGRIRLFRDN